MTENEKSKLLVLLLKNPQKSNLQGFPYTDKNPYAIQGLNI